MSKYFNTKERIKKKYRSQTMKQKAAAKAEKAAWLASEEGQAAIARINLASNLSEVLAPLIDQIQTKSTKESGHSELTESLAEKAAAHYHIKHGE